MNKKVLKKYLMIGIPSLLGVGGIITAIVVVSTDNKHEVYIPYQNQQQDIYGARNNQEQSPPPSQEEGDAYSAINRFEIFPDLNTYDFYEYLRVDDTHAYFTDEFIAAVIHKVIAEATITDGEIHFSYERVSETQLVMTFVWVRDNGDTYPKVYTFNISNN